MIIYIIIKLFMSYWLIFKLKWIKEIWKLSLSIDIIVLISFVYLLLIEKKINIITEIFIFSLIIISIFLIYRGINYIVQNEISWIKNFLEKEKIKSFLLKPKVNKIIYYGIWMLPWNIGYWIYFWIVENGWYARVWISSTRDIILWKVFKWDSREYFYNLFEKIKKNKINIYIKKKKDKIIKLFFRIIFITYYIRNEILTIKISKYIWIRMIMYMYLTIFYFYFFEELHIINKYLFYIIIFFEIMLLYKMEEIINYYEKDILSAWEKSGVDIDHQSNWKTLLYMFKNPFYWDAYIKWDFHITFWDITLCNSISLNILYEYILYVNKNTKGYFDKQMDIGTRDKRIRLMGVQIETDAIIWSILPRTRYVIINLRGFACETPYDLLYINYYLTAQNDINLINNKNIYLGYYEKTYSNTSLLMLVWILRNNSSYWNVWWNEAYDKYIEESKDYNFSYFLLSKRVNDQLFILYYTMYILKFDKRLIKDLSLIMEFFFNKQKYYFNDETYFLNKEYGLKGLIKNGKKIPISDKICGIKNYKKMFKIMGRIMWREEEAMTWNPILFEMLNNFKKSYIKILTTKSKEEKDIIYNNCMYKKIQTLRGEISYPSYFLTIEYYKEHEIAFVSDLVHLKDKEYKWLYKEFENLISKNGYINFDDFEINEKEGIINYFVLINSSDYLNILYVLVVNQQLYYENFKLQELEKSVQYDYSLNDFYNYQENWKEYKYLHKYLVEREREYWEKQKNKNE